MHIRTNPENSPRLAQLHKPEVYESLFIWWVPIFFCRLPSAFPTRTQQIWKIVFRNIAKETHTERRILLAKLGPQAYQLCQPISTCMVMGKVQIWGLLLECQWMQISAYQIWCWEKEHTHTPQKKKKNFFIKPRYVPSLYFPSFCS